MDNRVLTLISSGVFAAALLSGCAATPTAPAAGTEPTAAPPDPVTEARTAVHEAQSEGLSVEAAELFVRQAEQARAAEEEEQMQLSLDKAHQAIEARKAIEDARPLVAAAVKEAGEFASDAVKILDTADAALKAGDPVRALELASQARRQAISAVEQKKEAQARLEREAASRYTVVAGDSLWSIAGRPQVYGNPDQWPLLYRANRARIRDADLIRPGLLLTVDRAADEGAKSRAERHARERGRWQVGPVEASDRAYLR